MDATETFDLLVVGGGKGGKTLAVQRAKAGQRVAMVERAMIGGSCINVACIPTKTLVHAAKVADLARRAGEFGIRIGFEGADPAGVRRRRDAVVAQMVGRNQALFDQSGMDLVLGTARFVAPRTVAVALAGGGRRTLTAATVVVNTGTRPAPPPADVPGLAAAAPLDSTTVQRLETLPEHLIVLGGGYIGCEFAQLVRRLGSRVTVVDRNVRFLPREDADIGAAALAIFGEDGIDVRLAAEVERIEGVSGESVRLTLRTPAGSGTVEGSHLLLALGRVPNTDGLGVEAAGIALDDRGFIRVDEHLATTAPGTYAAGDVAGSPQFTHASLDDFRILAANLDGGRRSTRGRLIPYTLFIDPELGRVGLTEESARRAGHDVRVARLPAAAIPRAVTLGETRGLLKAVVDRASDRILGASILAPGGGEVMAVVQVAMQAGVTATALRDTIFAHPTLAESLGDLFARLD